MQSTAAAVAGLAEGESEALKAALDELQSLSLNKLNFTVVVGANHGVNIPVAGIKTADILVTVLALAISADTGTSATGNKVTDVTQPAATITSLGNIQLTVADLPSPNKLIVVWVANA